MKGRRHTPEQVVRKLREADRLLSEGQEPEVCKTLGSQRRSLRWRTLLGGMKADDVERLKELEVEEQRLKRIVESQTLHNEVSKGQMKGQVLADVG